MTRPKWNYVVDVVMFALMGAMIFIGVLMGFFLVSGPVADQSLKYVWGLHLHQWGDIHTILSFTFVAFFSLHLLLHWKWIKGATRSQPARNMASVQPMDALPRSVASKYTHIARASHRMPKPIAIAHIQHLLCKQRFRPCAAAGPQASWHKASSLF